MKTDYFGILFILFQYVACCFYHALLGVIVKFLRVGLFFSGLSLALVSFGGGMIASDASAWFDARNGERYNFIPVVFFEMALFVVIFNSVGKYRFF
ncbi:hypothetical protein [Acetobacter sp.]|uniref:hypothetical protein n=1 Tax=Acetobacter sp. TaxID=440 RepID=UPI0039E905B3